MGGGGGISEQKALDSSLMSDVIFHLCLHVSYNYWSRELNYSASLGIVVARYLNNKLYRDEDPPVNNIIPSHKSTSYSFWL